MSFRFLIKEKKLFLKTFFLQQPTKILLLPSTHGGQTLLGVFNCEYFLTYIRTSSKGHLSKSDIAV